MGSPSNEPLREYRRKRSFERTPEPDGAAEPRQVDGLRFVIQEHHARRLHWDLRLERDGVLFSWAVPKGLPPAPGENRLAVRTEDHPLSYLDFKGTIPEGEYGAGEMAIWDRGVYAEQKWTDDKVEVALLGERVRGLYALFRTDGNRWMIHRMDPPLDADWVPMPERIEPMKASLAPLPRNDADYGFEIKWDGVRAICFARGGTIRLQSRTMREITQQYPEIAPLGRALGSREAVLDGEIVSFDDAGHPSFQRLQRRMHISSQAAARRLASEIPVTYVAFDLLYLDGESLEDHPYEARREQLESLGLDGDSWRVPAYHRGDGEAMLAASREQELEGVVAKRLGSSYVQGRRGRDWLKIKNLQSQEFLIGGYKPGQGRRQGEFGSLLLGYWELDDQQPVLRFAGAVGTGFSDRDLAMLRTMLEPLARADSPFSGRQPPKQSVFTEPELIAAVAFSEWTDAGTLRAPVYLGLRDDIPAAEVVRESANRA